MGGGWYGNDTVWRMVLDLNRILIYGNPDGSMSDTPRRVFYSLTDALICGEGEWPFEAGLAAFGGNDLWEFTRSLRPGPCGFTPR